MPDPKIGRRCTIDLTDAADAEVRRLCEQTGIATADCFRYGLLLMKIYVNAGCAGKDVYVQKPGASEREMIVLPLFCGDSHA